MKDLIKTQHFTKQYEKILKNIDFHPKEAVDPFAGECDLFNYSPETKWTFYDIEPKKENVIKNDSLLNPIDYTGKTVITNPPYLAKNKTKEFIEIFEKYKEDDLYKASIKSIIGCSNGILIIPINFFTDENTEELRKIFLSYYKVSYVNVFSKPVFENTTYNVCSFYFEKGQTDKIIFYNIDEDTSFETTLYKEYGYRLGGEFYNSFQNIKPVFSRVRSKDDKFITNIFLSAIDKRKSPINLSYNKNILIGKNTDRVYATLTCEKELDENTQKILIDKFNDYLYNSRRKYQNLILTNYRDFGRKRISFDDVYKICTKILENING